MDYNNKLHNTEKHTGFNNLFNQLFNNINIKKKYKTCIDENNVLCDNLKYELDRKMDINNQNKQNRNLTRIEFEKCDTKSKSCNLLYSDLIAKNDTFKQIYTDIEELNKQNNDCNKIKTKCNSIKHNKIKFINCIKTYNKKCPTDLLSKITENQSMYANLKSTISNLEDAYNKEDCKFINSCDILLNKSKIAANKYNDSENILNTTVNKYNNCINPYENQCSDIYKNLEKHTKNTNRTLKLLESTKENFSINDNIKTNDELENIVQSNQDIKQKINILKNPPTDVIQILDREICTNILLTSICSVVLYYLFVEI